MLAASIWLVSASAAVAGHGNPGHGNPHSGNPGHGNSAAAHRCNHGGYRSLVGADGTTFRNTGACVRFAAHGGKFATGIIIPAGKVATLTNAHWALTPCDALTYGYQLNLGANVPLASKPGGPCVNGALPGATIGPFSTATLLRIFLTDTGDPAVSASCNFTFYSDGEHALVTGTNPGSSTSATASSARSLRMCPSRPQAWGRATST